MTEQQQGSFVPGILQAKNAKVGSHSLLQETNPEIKPRSPAWPADFLPPETPGKPIKLSEKCESKLQCGIMSYGQDGHHQKNLQTVNAREVMQRREFSYEVCGDVNWCSHYREQFLKNGSTI